MNERGIRILSLEAKEIYKQIVQNGDLVGYVLPSKEEFYYFSLFKNLLDYSLDAIALEQAYTKICGDTFSFWDEQNNEYTLAVINVKFNYTYKEKKHEKGLKELREYFYSNGFMLGGVRYVRYKRSSGSSRKGKCLFIDERMYDYMAKWGECGLNMGVKDLASWESYKSLSLSSIKGIIHIPLESMLFIPDYKSQFIEEVISVEECDNQLVSAKKEKMVTNDIWDGESLLDESMFTGNFADKHMLLLRNKFFKSCAFKTRLQKWFHDKNIQSVDQLTARGFITFATDVRQIKLVTTPNSMKFLKFMQGGLTKDNVQKWIEQVDDGFGVVKYDKRTKFFGGNMVQTSYQFINTLDMDDDGARELLLPSVEYIARLRDDYDLMHFHFTHANNREVDETKEEKTDGLAERSDVIFTLMRVNYAFKDTKLYYNFKNDVVKNQKDRLLQGNILLPGTNATLFGNGPEMLLALSGEFDLANPQNQSVALGKGEIACWKFEYEKRLVCARSPHITMGNLYYAKNNLSHGIWEYFDLGLNIVCVNAIGENIQQRLNGCDYDSDTMLLTDDAFIVDILDKQNDRFCVPVCSIASTTKENQTLVELDYATSENKIGEIVNLSQKINSVLWDKLASGLQNQAEIDEIYQDICILAVLSGIEIDKAKRAYPNIAVATELWRLYDKYGTERPQFFEVMDEKNVAAAVRYEKDAKVRKQKRKEMRESKEYYAYRTAMQYVYQTAKYIDHRKGKPKFLTFTPIIDMIREPLGVKTPMAERQRDTIVALCQEYKEILPKLYKKLRDVDEDEREVVYADIQAKKEEREQRIGALLHDEYVLYLVLQYFDKECETAQKKNMENWNLYAPILKSELFLKMLKNSQEQLMELVEDTDGDVELYGKKYKRVPAQH